METIPLADAKNRFSELVTSAIGTWERFLVTKNGRPGVYIIAAEDFESVLETMEVLSDPEAMAAIRESREPGSETYSEAEMAAIMADRLHRQAGAA